MKYKLERSLIYRPAIILIMGISMLITTQNGWSQSLITGLENKEEFDSLVLSIATPLYNLKFDETELRINSLKKRIPNHPIIDLLFAINISWQSLPEPLPAKFEIMQSYLESCIEKSETWLEKEPESPEPIFFLLMAHGLLAQYYNEQGSTFKTMGEAKRAYKDILLGFDLKDQYNEFLFSCGLYNYYLERYPQLYPAYRSFTWLFRSGDIETGLLQLDSARKETVLSRVEAAHYLAYIYLRYENNPTKAISIMVPLVLEFPYNMYFKLLLLESYMAIDKLEQVSDMINDLSVSSRPYYKLCGNAFYGELFEKYYSDDLKAEKYYNEAIQISDSIGSKEIQSLAASYAGLARINARRNKIEKAKEYYKLAGKYAQTESLRQEARNFQKEN